MAKTENFVARVLKFITGGDEAKVTRFQKKVAKFAKTQVDVRENEIDDLNEKLVDLSEKYTETLLAVDVEKIKNADYMDSYVESYVKRAFAVKDEIASVENAIKALEAEVAKFKALATDLE